MTPFDSSNLCNSADLISYIHGMLQWAVREESVELRTLTQKLCRLMKLIFKPVLLLGTRELTEAQTKSLLNDLDQLLPEREHSILLHMISHIVTQQFEWGFISMFIFERTNSLIKSLILSRRYPEGSFAKNYDRQVVQNRGAQLEQCITAASGMLTICAHYVH